MNIIRKIKYNQYWNIGFCEQTSEELMHEGGLRPIKWLKHEYDDRWFADPFILRATEDEIVVFVEECLMDTPKGIICELVINRKTMNLKERYVLLDKETHLSYPAIIMHDGKVYVYPENGASGKLNIYEYDEANHRLFNPVCILEEAVADATIFINNNCYYLTATKFPSTQEKVYLYKLESIFGPFTAVSAMPFQKDIGFSRCGGNFFYVDGNRCRPVQDCKIRYGAALNIMRSTLNQRMLVEELQLSIKPQSWRYDLGVHTINFCDGICVIDGYGYFYPAIAHALIPLKRCVHLLKVSK